MFIACVVLEMGCNEIGLVDCDSVLRPVTSGLYVVYLQIIIARVTSGGAVNMLHSVDSR